MGILDRLFGTKPDSRPAVRGSAAPPASPDEQAIARYRYLLRTAPPDALEQAHAEAFARLTPDQRAQVLAELSHELPASERGHANDSDARTLARMATRAELRQPGTLERAFGQRGGMGMGAGGMGMGGLIAGSLFSSIAGTVIGTTIAHSLLGGFDGGGDASPTHDASTADDSSAAADDQYADGSIDEAGSNDFGGADDFGGGDFDI